VSDWSQATARNYTIANIIIIIRRRRRRRRKKEKVEVLLMAESATETS